MLYKNDSKPSASEQTNIPDDGYVGRYPLNRAPDLLHEGGSIETFAKTNELRFNIKLVVNDNGKTQKQRVLEQMELSSRGATRWVQVPLVVED
jgi:hypothetical protein